MKKGKMRIAIYNLQRTYLLLRDHHVIIYLLINHKILSYNG
jgi:hypothetical protein